MDLPYDGTGLPPRKDRPRAGTPYDPADHNIDDVKKHVTENPDSRAAVLALEQAGQDRVTLVEWLTKTDEEN